MAENTKNTLTKAVIANAARGGIKAIPFAGALIDQMIFGTMDQVEASRQAAHLRTTLAGIQSSIDVDSATLIEVLERLDAPDVLGQQTAALLQELIAVVRQGEAAEPSPDLVQAVEALFQRHGHQLEDVAGNIDGSASRLEQALNRIEALQPVGVGETSLKEVDRIPLILALNALDSVNLGTVIVGLDASRYVSATAPPQQRVSELVVWADGAGPGLPEVYRVARQLVPNFG